MSIQWNNERILISKSYICGYCGKSLASQKGYDGHKTGFRDPAYIYICHHCQKPTFFDLDGKQTPGVIFGNKVNDISDKVVADLYDEARKCTNNEAFTATVLCCRKLLMHIAVSKGAKAGQSFIEYVEYLANKNYIPLDAKDWVDQIRSKGNEANHEISIRTKEEAEDLISFSEMLLKLIYEFPANIKRKSNSPQ